ncbi:MFS general substrate transporter [Artomyces pyxidatus]|uniref:MFS general substrate transporter n=1 Tax=Artomyces pyxidatus TaxID=48021 RepID=A0ACB8TIA3_9AGAM|nr:MFS general substrate transporter [Artomyces pyxidatus]
MSRQSSPNPDQIPTSVDDHGKGIAPPSSHGHESTIAEISKDKSDSKPDVAQVKDRPYSVFSKREKWIIVNLASYAALFSPLTANIYFPAIPVLAEQFHKSTELINLTITIYMVMQGLAPMVWGTFSDKWGRRPIFVACLAILSLSCVGLALTPTSAYWLLLLLRCIQAAGSASTVALGAGVIGDIATPEERGGFLGVFGIAPLVGPTIGPVIGGGLAQGLGWRSIFWFLCISSGISAIGILLIMPETLRALVGDGSIVPSPIYRPFIPVVGRHLEKPPTDERPPPKPFINPLRMFTYPDVVCLLVFNGILYAVFYGVTATISTLFQSAYPFLNETDIGLCFLAVGGGMLIGTTTSGKLLNRDYISLRDKLVREAQADSEKEVDVKAIEKDGSFPIEKARLRSTHIYVIVYIACIVGYGWCLQKKVSIAVPLILQIIIGIVCVSVMNTVQTLLVDLAPQAGSSITACNNLIRCSLGAGLVSVIDLILKALGTGWTYVLLGGLCVLVSPLIYVLIHWGPTWRERRRIRALILEGKA